MYNNNKTEYIVPQGRGAQIFQKSGTHLKFLCAIRKLWSQFQTEDTQMLGSIVQQI